jgi:uncharacterized protein YhbP (UPF0306 family)
MTCDPGQDPSAFDPTPARHAGQVAPAINQAIRHPQVQNLLQTVTTMTLATSDGVHPHAAPVYFTASPDLDLYFFSDRDSLHSQQVRQNPLAAAAIYPACQGWQDIRGLQIHGEICLVESPATWESAWRLYREKFPFVRALKTIVAQNQMYVLTPTWIRLVDNAQGFGFKQEYGKPQLR